MDGSARKGSASHYCFSLPVSDGQEFSRKDGSQAQWRIYQMK